MPARRNDSERRFRRAFTSAIYSRNSISSARMSDKFDAVFTKVHFNVLKFIFTSIIDSDIWICHIAEIALCKGTFVRTKYCKASHEIDDMNAGAASARRLFLHGIWNAYSRIARICGTRDRFSRYFCIAACTASWFRRPNGPGRRRLFRHMLRAPHEPDAIAKYQYPYFHNLIWIV